MSRVISAIDITKKYEEGKPILNGITLHLERGVLYSITGESGAGKSTLLHILGLLDQPSSGKVSINGEWTNGMKAKQLATLRMKFIGFVFQAYHLNPLLNVEENIMLPMYINPVYDARDMKRITSELLDEIGMKDKGKNYPNELSGGEQQRVAIARSLSNNPQLILADEPTGNLDAANEKIVFELFKRYTERGKTVVVISHSERVLNYSDINFHLKNGVLENKVV